MIEKALSLSLPPGLYRQGTDYQSKGRWFDANLVRWHEGAIGPVGGWRNITSATPDTLSTESTELQVEGRPRAAYGWRTSDSISKLAIGTHDALWLYVDGGLTEITPVDFPDTSAQLFVDGTFVAGGYGSGPYGIGYYGTGTGALTLVAPGTWTLDTFGDLLVACHTVDGRVLSADPIAGTPAEPAANAPVSNAAIVVTPEHFIVALGADGIARVVQWADQETLDVWSPSEENQAGAFELPTRGRLVSGRRTRRQTILWTDVDVFSMTYVGGTEVYQFEQLGDNCGLIAPNAAIVLGDRMFWMSYGKFFEYDGALKPMQCDVLDFIFGDIDQAQRGKVTAIPMTLFDEVWWLYPSKGRTSNENDKYVSYNFRENHWAFGELPRGCGIDRGVFEFPVMIDPDGFLFEHEFGSTRNGEPVFAESGPVELGEGDKLMRVQHIIPDERTQGDTTMTLFGRFYPNGPETQVGPFVAANPTPTRLTARQVRFRLDEATQTDWRVGVPRLGVIPAGGR